MFISKTGEERTSIFKGEKKKPIYHKRYALIFARGVELCRRWGNEAKLKMGWFEGGL